MTPFRSPATMLVASRLERRVAPRADGRRSTTPLREAPSGNPPPPRATTAASRGRRPRSARPRPGRGRPPRSRQARDQAGPGAVAAAARSWPQPLRVLEIARLDPTGARRPLTASPTRTGTQPRRASSPARARSASPRPGRRGPHARRTEPAPGPASAGRAAAPARRAAAEVARRGGGHRARARLDGARTLRSSAARPVCHAQRAFSFTRPAPVTPAASTGPLPRTPPRSRRRRRRRARRSPVESRAAPRSGPRGPSRRSGCG